jgi:Carboxypeptidase regulatory-like domain
MAAALLTICTWAAHAQQPTGVSLTIIVTDQTGAVISSARVRATSVSTLAIVDRAVDESGTVRLDIPVGTYDLRVEAPHFPQNSWNGFELRRAEEKRVVLKPAQLPCTLPCDFPLYPDIPVERAEVSATVPLSPLDLLPLRPKPIRRHWL